MSALEQKNNTVSDVKSNIPSFTIDDMVRAGVHFGHRLGARNPRARHYIYGEVNDIHLIDLRKSYYSLQKALEVLFDHAKRGKRIVFVSTLEKFTEQVKDIAARTGQHYVCSWKGGMLTNWRTTVASIKTLQKFNRILESAEEEDEEGVVQRHTKKELVDMKKRRDRLHKSFGGIADMDGMPDLVVVLSVHAERLAISETRCIGTPVIGVIDTNSDPTLVEYPIPGNDDSLRVVKFYGDLFTTAILNGTKEWLARSGVAKTELVIDAETNLIKTVGNAVASISQESKEFKPSQKKDSRKNAPNKVKRQATSVDEKTPAVSSSIAAADLLDVVSNINTPDASNSETHNSVENVTTQNSDQ